MNHLLKYSLRLGDNALILGQRMSEWCGHGPFLEEDIAMANSALDYVGRARLLYSYAATIDPVQGRDEDFYAFCRDEPEFENLQICELPNGDYAFTILRQFLFDHYCVLVYRALSRFDKPSDQLPGLAAKIVKESSFHLARSTKWVQRLGLGTTESNLRMKRALEELWGYTREFFDYDETDRSMVSIGACPEKEKLRSDWSNLVEKLLFDVSLKLPESKWEANGGRQGVHTEHMGRLLAEMQVLQRRYPSLSW